MTKDEVNKFVDEQMDMLKEGMNNLFEVMLTNAVTFHDNKCDAPKDVQKECLDEFMQGFVALISAEMLLESQKKEKVPIVKFVTKHRVS